MSIKKIELKSGGFSYRVNVNRGIINGKRKSALRTAKSMPEARLIEARLKLEIANGTYQDKDDLPDVKTFNDLYAQWWPIYVETVEGSTAYKTKQLFKNHLLKKFGAMDLDKIKAGRIQAVVMLWHKDTTKAYKQRFIYLKKILGFAVKMEYIKKNPAENVELPRAANEGGKKPEYWDNIQVAKFLGCIDPVANPEKYTMFLLLVSTGIRREELCALDVSDIDFNAATLSITKAYATGLNGKESIKGTKTGASVRTIPLRPKVVIQLRKWVAFLESGKIVGFKKNQPLFPSPEHPNKRIGINRPNTWLKAIISDNKLTPELTLHGLRRSFVTNMLRSGADVSTVQRLAGHSTPDMTLRIYAGMNEDDARKGIAKLDAYMK